MNEKEITWKEVAKRIMAGELVEECVAIELACKDCEQPRKANEQSHMTLWLYKDGAWKCTHESFQGGIPKTWNYLNKRYWAQKAERDGKVYNVFKPDGAMNEVWAKQFD